MSEVIHVVAGVVRDPQGRVLVAQRPTGKHLAGLWEFPGGKCETGELPHAALRRELAEEIGIEVDAVESLIRIPWRYPEKEILLDVYGIHEFRGEPRGLESQALRWCSPQQLRTLPMPPADRPVVVALNLPEYYAITPEPTPDIDAFLDTFKCVLGAGIKFIQLRSKKMPRESLASLAVVAQRIAREAGATMLINGHVELVQELNLDGVHVSAEQLMRLRERPLPLDRWVGASCHTLRELQHAAATGVDFATLGPVRSTPSHPDASYLGWDAFANLSVHIPLPVYALGGLGKEDLAHSRNTGAHGVAGISAFWR